MENLDRLAIHTMTTKPWDFPTAVEKYSRAGVRGVGLWRQWLEGRSLAESRALLDGHGMKAVSLGMNARPPLTTTAAPWMKPLP